MASKVERILGSNFDVVGKVGWVGFGFVAAQVIRLGTNIALAWLLAPALLGTMLLINTLRTAGELLTDVGIGQSIVNNRRGEEAKFYNTAWTMQIVRGLLLFCVALAASAPLASAYDDPRLSALVSVAAIVFVVSGFTSTNRFLLQKRMEVRRSTTFNVSFALLGAIVHIVFALYSPTIWALLWGLIVSTLLTTIGTYFLIPENRHRLQWDREAFDQIFSFGKWIFFSSIVYFAAMNFDRLYLASAVPFAILGVYGVARTFADTILFLFQRMANMIVFPKISESHMRGYELQETVAPLRYYTLLAVATLLAAGLSIADQFILWAYDQRFSAAAQYLPLMLLGTWFAILASLSDAMMMGIGKPSITAYANAFKFAIIALAVPIVLPTYGLLIAIAFFSVAEIGRYVVLTLRMRGENLSFTRQDIAGTLAFIVMALVFRAGTGLVGLTSGVEGWAAIANAAVVGV